MADEPASASDQDPREEIARLNAGAAPAYELAYEEARRALDGRSPRPTTANTPIATHESVSNPQRRCRQPLDRDDRGRRARDSLVSFHLAVTPQAGVPASPSSGERSQQLQADSDPSAIIWRGR